MKMKTVISAYLIMGVLVCTGLIGTTGCGGNYGSAWGLPRIDGSGIMASETRELADFNGVALHDAAGLEIVSGSQHSVTITSDDNIIPLITTDISDGVLHISRSENFRSKSGLKILITAPSISSVSIHSSGSVKLSGSQADIFKAHIYGSGSIIGDGHHGKVEATIQGSGNIDLSNGSCHEASASISGSGSIILNPSELLIVKIAGSGSVKYKGSPEIKLNISGSGSVKQIE